MRSSSCSTRPHGEYGGGESVGAGPDCDIDVEIPVDAVVLKGHLHLPEPVAGVVLFAHGSGSGRYSPRNQFVAEVLYRAGMGTLLLDLLTAEEELNRANVFDVELFASRLTAATRWLRDRPDAASCRVGYFGASTGTDEAVLKLNQSAQARLQCTNRLTVVEGATHLFGRPPRRGDVGACLVSRDSRLGQAGQPAWVALPELPAGLTASRRTSSAQETPLRSSR